MRHGTSHSYTIPYRDIIKALNRLELNNEYTILAMGVSPHLFKEIDGFVKTKGETDYIYNSDVKVIEIASNENSFIIMKNVDIPRICLRPLDENEKDVTLEEVESTNHLYSNIDFINKDNLILKAVIGYYLYVPKPFKYVRLRLSYQLESDEFVINKLSSIKTYIV